MALSCLDATFQALADGARRPMIQALALGGARAGELGRHSVSAQPTMSRHLKVLARAGLVERSIEGRVHSFGLRSGRLDLAQRRSARKGGEA